MYFACGTVIMFWVSNTPARKKCAFSGTSNLVPRGDVVCVTDVVSARSVSRTGTLSTRQGRTFAVIPRSTSQTSPRSGVAIDCLAMIEFQEQFLGAED